MNKKGFTLVELSLSLALILLLVGFIASRLVNIDGGTKQEMLDAKIEIILDAAKKYGADHIDELKSSETNLTKRKCTKEITVNTLVQMNYLEGDDEYGYQVINPLDNSVMNNEVVCLGYIDRKVVVDLKKNVK